MNPSSSNTFFGPVAIGLTTAVALLARTAGAQADAPRSDEPRVSALVGIGAGSTPDLSLSTPGRQTVAMHAALGVRVRTPRRFFVDGGVRVQQAISTYDDIVVANGPSAGARFASGVRGRDVVGSADVRLGVESHAESGKGPLLRASAGGGYMWSVAEPFASAAVGIGTHGRRARLTLDLEHRWFRLPVEDVTVTNPGGTALTLGVTGGHVGAGETSVRFGLEVPL